MMTENVKPATLRMRKSRDRAKRGATITDYLVHLGILRLEDEGDPAARNKALSRFWNETLERFENGDDE
jgi:hypothetical protein